MDFYDVFRPIQVVIWMFLFKELMIKSPYGKTKVIMSFSALWIAMIVNSYFDSDKNNDTQLWILAIPISIILFSQAFIDFHFYFYNPDSKQRTFYNLDNPLKKVWVLGNCGSTLIYSICLFRWLWII